MPLSGRWKTKPPPGTPINWSHPYTKGLVAAWLFNEGQGNPIELVGQQNALSSANLTWVSGPNGSRASFNGASTDIKYNNVPAVGPAMSVAGGSVLTTVNSNYMMIEREAVNATWAVLGVTGAGLELRGGSGVQRATIDLTISGAAGTPLPVLNNQYFSWCFADNGIQNAGGVITAYIGGFAVGTSDNTQAPAVSNANPIHLGNYDNSGYFLGGTQDYIYLWNWMIPADMVFGIANDPWQIWAPSTAWWLYHPTLLSDPIASFGMFTV